MIETDKSNRNAFYTCHYHVVWCPKYRRKVEAIETRLQDSIGQAWQEHQAEVEELEVMPDPVHLLVSIDPQFGIHWLMKLIKGCRLVCCDKHSRCSKGNCRLCGRTPLLWVRPAALS
jgi:putative transposase